MNTANVPYAVAIPVLLAAAFWLRHRWAVSPTRDVATGLTGWQVRQIRKFPRWSYVMTWALASAFIVYMLLWGIVPKP